MNIIFKNKTIVLFDLPGKNTITPTTGMLRIISFLEDKKIKCDYHNLSFEIFTDLNKKINKLFSKFKKNLINQKGYIKIEDRLLINIFKKFVSKNTRVINEEKNKLSIF